MYPLCKTSLWLRILSLFGDSMLGDFVDFKMKRDDNSFKYSGRKAELAKDDVDYFALLPSIHEVDKCFQPNDKDATVRLVNILKHCLDIYKELAEQWIVENNLCKRVVDSIDPSFEPIAREASLGMIIILVKQELSFFNAFIAYGIIPKALSIVKERKVVSITAFKLLTKCLHYDKVIATVIYEHLTPTYLVEFLFPLPMEMARGEAILIKYSVELLWNYLECPITKEYVNCSLLVISRALDIPHCDKKAVKCFDILLHLIEANALNPTNMNEFDSIISNSLEMLGTTKIYQSEIISKMFCALLDHGYKPNPDVLHYVNDFISKVSQAPFRLVSILIGSGLDARKWLNAVMNEITLMSDVSTFDYNQKRESIYTIISCLKRVDKKVIEKYKEKIEALCANLLEEDTDEIKTLVLEVRHILVDINQCEVPVIDEALQSINGM